MSLAPIDATEQPRQSFQHAPVEIRRPASPAEIEALEARLLNVEQLDLPLTHTFAPGLYFREIFMPSGAFVIGHEHKTEHLNAVLTGRALVMMDGEVREIVAPCVFKSSAGVRKILYIAEDMRWATLHPTAETDLQKLEDQLITKSAAFIEHEQLQKLRAHVAALPAGETP